MGVWSPVQGQTLLLKREPTNAKDRDAVGVFLVVGHVPHNLALYFSHLGQEEHVSEDECNEDIDTPTLKITNYKDAIESLDNVRQFLENKGHVQEALQVGTTVDTLTSLILQLSKQTTLHDYFTSMQS